MCPATCSGVSPLKKTRAETWGQSDNAQSLNLRGGLDWMLAQGVIHIPVSAIRGPPISEVIFI